MIVEKLGCRDILTGELVGTLEYACWRTGFETKSRRVNFPRGNRPVISTCLEEGGADPDFAVFMRGAGFPEAQEGDIRVDYLRMLRCFAEVLPPRQDEDYHIVNDVLQARAEGRRKEKVAAVL